MVDRYLRRPFDSAVFLGESGLGRTVVHRKAKQPFFVQGSPADCVYYLQTGRAKLTVTSKNRKSATITLLNAGDFVGEESISGEAGLRVSTAVAVTDCTALKIDGAEMLRVLREERSFADMFLKFMLARGMRTQADLIDQLFNSSEQRLARILLLMAEFTAADDQPNLIPSITQEALADMVGTTRSRVSFFMNRFRRMGLIEYNGRIRVHRSLLDVMLRDQWTESHTADATRSLKGRTLRFPGSIPSQSN